MGKNVSEYLALELVTMDNLYVHLQSDSSPAYFPNNKITDFRNQLSSKLDIDTSNYEVALVQCSYVYNPPNLKTNKTIANIEVFSEVKGFDFDISRTIKNISGGLSISEKLIDYQINLIPSTDFEKYLFSNGTSEDLVYKNCNLVKNKSNNMIMVCEKTVEYYLPVNVKSFEDLTSEINKGLSKYYTKLHTDEKSAKLETDQSKSFVFEVVLHYDVSVIYGLENNRKACPGKPTPEGLINQILKDNVKTTKSTPLFTVKYLQKYQDCGKICIQTNKHILQSEKVGSSLIEIPVEDYFNKMQSPSFANAKKSTAKVKVKNDLYRFALKRDVYNLEDLIRAVNEAFGYNAFGYVNNTIIWDDCLTSPRAKITLDPQIAAIFGMTDYNVLSSVETTEGHTSQLSGKFRPYFGYGQQKMYIYANIVENQFIGNQMAPILRIADYKGIPATTTTQEFTNNHYIPLRNQSIDQIHMYIRSETSDFLPIELGSFSATLHFRRKRF